MKTVKMITAFMVGMIIFVCGLAIMGVPADLPAYRWMIGTVFLGTALIVWDKWA